MLAARSLALCAALALLAACLASPAPRAPRHRRQLADDDQLQPLDEADADEQTREKRKLEGITQAKFGIKNAVLGFVFGKINSIIDAKTRFVDQLDRKNIEINKQYGIEPPQSPLATLGGVVGQIVSGIGPKIQAVSGLLGGASGASSGGSSGGGGQGGSGLGSILSLVTSLSGSSSGGAGATGTIETIDSSEEDTT